MSAPLLLPWGGRRPRFPSSQSAFVHPGFWILSFFLSKSLLLMDCVRLPVKAPQVAPVVNTGVAVIPRSARPLTRTPRQHQCCKGRTSHTFSPSLLGPGTEATASSRLICPTSEDKKTFTSTNLGFKDGHLSLTRCVFNQTYLPERL